MKCENCIHNVICSADAYFKSIDDCEKYCCHYKDKSLFVEFPCKVGTPVYFIEEEVENDDDRVIFDGRVVSFIKQQNVVDMYCRYDVGLTYYHNIEDIGKTVFLTKEEAEKKLKEIEV